MKLSDLPPVTPIPEGNPYIMQIPVVSNAHISPSDMDVIQEGSCTLTAQDGDNQCTILRICAWENETYSMDLFTPEANRLFSALAAKGYGWVRFDGDFGDKFSDLPTFDW